jgi:hypothetical protein
VGSTLPDLLKSERFQECCHLPRLENRQRGHAD